MQPARWATRGFARMGLVAAWAVFFLNTALFPCCEVAAAVLGGHADATQAEPLEHGPDSPCVSSLGEGPTIVGEHEVLSPDRSPLAWFAIDAPFTARLTAVDHSANLALARAEPPPPLRLYLRTQRLLL
jgi:hypothetical protein